MEQQWKDNDSRKWEDWEKNLSWCHFVHHKFHWTALGANLDLHDQKPAHNHVYYGMAILMLTVINTSNDKLPDMLSTSRNY
jgi:hypothetical protein